MKFNSALFPLLFLSSANAFAPSSNGHAQSALFSTATESEASSTSASAGDRDILVRAALGQEVERTPVWLMRQAGRYMAEFREYSTKYPFRQRSETPSMATELSLQCHRAYGMDGIIMFSDILTPLPTLGIDFDVVRGKGPQIYTEVRTEEDVAKMSDPADIDFDEKLPFIREILEPLQRKQKRQILH